MLLGRWGHAAENTEAVAAEPVHYLVTNPLGSEMVTGPDFGELTLGSGIVENSATRVLTRRLGHNSHQPPTIV